MKWLLLIISIILLAVSLKALFPLISNYDLLTQYGKGYLVGNGLLLILGGLFAGFGYRAFRK